MKTAVICFVVFAGGIAVGMGLVGTRAADKAAGAESPGNRTAAAAPSGETRKRVGLVAHDAAKGELLAWVERNAAVLAEQELFSTGTTGRLVAETMAKALPGREINLTRFNSGPLGGDQQMGALIAQNGLDILVFFVDPLTAHPHDSDVKALLRLCGVYNTVLAITPSTADFVIASPYFAKAYSAKKMDYSSYVNRQVK